MLASGSGQQVKKNLPPPPPPIPLAPSASALEDDDDQGPRTYHICKGFGFFEPLTPLFCIRQLIYTIQFTQPQLLCLLYGDPHPRTHHGCHMCMFPQRKSLPDAKNATAMTKPKPPLPRKPSLETTTTTKKDLSSAGNDEEAKITSSAQPSPAVEKPVAQGAAMTTGHSDTVHTLQKSISKPKPAFRTN